MDKKTLDALLMSENEYRKGSIGALHKIFEDADVFLNWIISSKCIFQSELEAVCMYLSAHTENRTIELRDGVIEYSNIKYDYKITLKNERLVAEKYHGNVSDNSTAFMSSIDTKDPESVLEFLL